MKARICTTESGMEYLVQRIDFRTRTVFCWGEVVSYKGLSTRHATSKEFPLDDVVINDVNKTQDLIRTLFEQTKARIRENDDMVRERALRGGRLLKRVIVTPDAIRNL